MVITVQNISATSARASWPSAPGCLETWHSLLMDYTRKSSLLDRIPVGQTSTQLAGLTPRTTYILCMTCEAADLSGEQCQVFRTKGDGSVAGQDIWELAMGVWMASVILLLVIAGVLLCGCLYSICHFCNHPDDGYPRAYTVPQPGNQGNSPGRLCTPAGSENDSILTTVMENPFQLSQTPGHKDGQGQQLRTFYQQSDGGSQSGPCSPMDF